MGMFMGNFPIDIVYARAHRHMAVPTQLMNNAIASSFVMRMSLRFPGCHGCVAINHASFIPGQPVASCS